MAVVRGTGNLQVPVIVVCGGALILIPLSPALIFGAFGYQGLGPSGGAVAMLVYYAFGTLAYAAYLWGRFGVLKPSFRLHKLSLEPSAGRSPRWRNVGRRLGQHEPDARDRPGIRGNGRG